jgi:DNA-binding MarR family transcriptional regulator/GNAT superfamily N-acetyltransferase
MKKEDIAQIRLFNRFYTRIIGLLDNHILNSQYSLPEARVMFEVYHNPQISASELVSAIGIDKGYLSRILLRLEKDGLLTKTVAPKDKRSLVLKLTDKGEQAFTQLNMASEAQIATIFRHLSAIETGQLIQAMHKIKQLVDGSAGHGDSGPSLAEVSIRTELKAGDLGFVLYRHGALYTEEYGFGFSFESYVAKEISEFYQQYDPARDRIWVCEHDQKIIGFLALMHRGPQIAQLRYFYLEKEYRGIGLGKKLMAAFMDFLVQQGYTLAYLLTTSELDAATTLYKRWGFVLTQAQESTAFGRLVTEQRYDWRASPELALANATNGQ